MSVDHGSCCFDAKPKTPIVYARVRVLTFVLFSFSVVVLGVSLRYVPSVYVRMGDRVVAVGA